MNRRDALRGFGIGALATGAGARGFASDADAQEVRGRVNTRSEPSQLKITDLRVVGVRGHWLVRLDTNQGLHGYGEVRDGASPTYALMLKSRVVGENPCHVDKLFRKVKQFGFSRAAGRRRGRARDGVLGPRREGLGRALLADARRQVPRPDPRVRRHAGLPRPRRDGQAAQGPHGARFHVPQDGREREPAEGRRRRPDVPERPGRRPVRPVRARHVRAAASPLHRHPHHRQGPEGPAGVRRDGERDRRLGDPDRHGPLRPLRHRGRHQARAGARPVQPRLARGHGAVAVHRPVACGCGTPARRRSSPARTST